MASVTYAYIHHDFTGTFLDYPDNESIAVLIYFYGCEHFCSGCHNKNFSDYKLGLKICYEDFAIKVLEYLKKYNTNKLVLSGGDPLFYKNRDLVTKFVYNYSKLINIIIYTGYDLEVVKKFGITGYTFLKCGKYLLNQSQNVRKTDLKFILASKNQKLYNKNNKLISNNGVYFFGGSSWKSFLKMTLMRIKRLLSPKKQSQIL